MITSELPQSHQLKSHLEFPFYNDPPPSDTKIMQEIQDYLKALCISELNLRENSSYPTKPSVQEDQTWLIDPMMDWNTLDLDQLIPTLVEDIKEPEVTLPETICLPISSLWLIVRIQHLCKTQDVLFTYLGKLDPHYYEVQSDFIHVKHFQPEKQDDDDTPSVSSEDSW